MVASNMVGRGLSKVSRSSRKCHKHKTLHITHNHTNTPVSNCPNTYRKLHKSRIQKLTAYSILEHGHKYIHQNIARIANAVQVTICLLVSTSVY